MKGQPHAPFAGGGDVANPDPALRERPLLGLPILEQFEWDDNVWSGRIYDPVSGKTYASRLNITRGQLKIRGYVGVPMFGRTETLEKLAEVTSEMPWLPAGGVELCR